MALAGARDVGSSGDESVETASGAPAFRAFWPKFTVATIKRAPDALRAPVLRAIAKPLREEIRMATNFEWQAARVFMELTQSIASCGDDVATAFWRHSLRQSISQPIIRTLVDGGVHLFGRSPEALYKRTPRAWSLVSRHCGAMSVSSAQPNQVVLSLEGVPSSCRSHDGILLLLAGGFRGQADFLMKTEIDVKVAAASYRRDGKAEFTIRW